MWASRISNEFCSLHSSANSNLCVTIFNFFLEHALRDSTPPSTSYTVYKNLIPVVVGMTAEGGAVVQVVHSTAMVFVTQRIKQSHCSGQQRRQPLIRVPLRGRIVTKIELVAVPIIAQGVCHESIALGLECNP